MIFFPTHNTLSGMPLEELAELISPLPRFRAAQIFKWIAAGADSFDTMDNLPLSLRGEFAKRFKLRPDADVTQHQGNDGTVKLALRFADGAKVEAVLLNDGLPSTRFTACLSTQAGCPVGCVFCKTGASFLRNLNSAEIVEQFFQLKTQAEKAISSSEEDASLEEGAPTKTERTSPLPIANIVVMGMGEPLLNLAELRRALAVICDKKGMNFSRRRITVSTCGISRGIADLADNGPPVRLALSLTTGEEGLRRRLMPISEGEPLSSVKEALKLFQERGGGRITLEAVLLGGLNTRNEDAAGIAKFAQGLDAVVNLIPWNPVKGLTFEGKALREPSNPEVESFTRRLEALGLNVTRRFRRGRGIAGACGQLSG
jgi:23S rRNA (adenine2503-C2)-methyltransferase